MALKGKLLFSSTPLSFLKSEEDPYCISTYIEPSTFIFGLWIKARRRLFFPVEGCF